MSEFFGKHKNEVKRLREQIVNLKDYTEGNKKVKEYLGNFYIVNIGDTFEVKGLESISKLYSNNMKLECKNFNEYILDKIKDAKDIHKIKAIWTSYIFLYHAGNFCAYNYRVNGIISDKERGDSKVGQEFLKIFIPQKRHRNMGLKTYSILDDKEKEYFDPKIKRS